MLTRRDFIASPVALAAAPAPVNNLALWYKQPAKLWTEALPVGNGRLGAMVFWGVESERLQLNEDTLWSGFPKDWNNPAAKTVLPEIRRLLRQEKYTEADALCRKMQGPYNQSYLPLDDLNLPFEGLTDAINYRRELNLHTAIATTTFQSGQPTYTREVFVSFPDQLIVLRCIANGPDKLNVSATLSSALRSKCRRDGAAALQLTGKAPAHVDPNYRTPNPIICDEAEGKGMRFAALLEAKAEGFKTYAEAPDKPIEAIIAAARAHQSSKSYIKLRAAHIADHQALFRRVALTINSTSRAHLPTDERLEAFKKSPEEDALHTLYFQYGRYLLIASSRPGTQPANLQGIWNDNVRPPWSSNWTTNINVQMNYWHAETANLAECHQPLFDLTEGLSKNGAKTAQINYGARGWVSHHNADIWCQTAPVGNFGLGSPTWANWQMSGPWFCQHLWEHYAFTGDKNFL